MVAGASPTPRAPGGLMAGRIQRAALALAGWARRAGSAGRVGRCRPGRGSASGGSAACTDGTGITVVVDASAFGDGVQVRCAPQPVRSGFDALTARRLHLQRHDPVPWLALPHRRRAGRRTPVTRRRRPTPTGPTGTHPAVGRGPTAPREPAVGSHRRAASRVGPSARRPSPGVDPPDPTPTTTTRPPTTTTPPSGGGTGGGTDGGTDGGTGDDATGPRRPTAARPRTDDLRPPKGRPMRPPPPRDAGAGGSEDDEDGPQEAGSVSGPADGGSSGGGSPAGAIVGLVAVAALAIAGIRVARRRRSEEGLA